MGKVERVPWDRMIEDQGKFIDPEYLPDGLLLSSNNHKFQKRVVDAILKHWTTRDAEGNIPFRFKNPVKRGNARVSSGRGGPRKRREGGRKVVVQKKGSSH